MVGEISLEDARVADAMAGAVASVADCGSCSFISEKPSDQLCGFGTSPLQQIRYLIPALGTQALISERKKTLAGAADRSDLSTL
jgi:hypothetical protein